MGSGPIRTTTTAVLVASAAVFDVSIDELVGRRRSFPLTAYRQASMLAARQLTGASFPSLGRAFGGRDHTTVMYLCAQADPELVAAVVDAVAGVSSTTLRSEVELLRAEVAALRCVVEGQAPVPVSAGQLRLAAG